MRLFPSQVRSSFRLVHTSNRRNSRFELCRCLNNKFSLLTDQTDFSCCWCCALLCDHQGINVTHTSTILILLYRAAPCSTDHKRFVQPLPSAHRLQPNNTCHQSFPPASVPQWVGSPLPPPSPLWRSVCSAAGSDAVKKTVRQVKMVCIAAVPTLNQLPPCCWVLIRVAGAGWRPVHCQPQLCVTSSLDPSCTAAQKFCFSPHSVTHHMSTSEGGMVVRKLPQCMNDLHFRREQHARTTDGSFCQHMLLRW